MRLFACLIVAPQWGYDEPAILSYAISSFCPTSADGLHAVAKVAGVSRSTVVNAAADLAAEARREARKQARQASQASATPKPAAKPLTEARQRAQRFLKDALAHGPKPVTDIEEQAGKAHVDSTALAQARGDLGIVTSRGNTGRVQAVQWSLPG